MARIPCDVQGEAPTKREIDTELDSEERGRRLDGSFVGVVENSMDHAGSGPGHHPATAGALIARLCVDTREASRIARAAKDVIGRVGASQAPPPHTHKLFFCRASQFVEAEPRGTGGEEGLVKLDLPAVSWRC